MNRRESLAAVAGIAGTLAGCTAFDGDSSMTSHSPTVTERSVSDGPKSGVLSDPALLKGRSDGPDPPIRFGGQDTMERHNRFGRRRVLESTVIDTQSRANQLAVGPGIDREQVDTFVSATTFDTETLYLEQAEIGACFTLNLCRIAWQPDEVSTDYGQQTRPYTERCKADQQVFEARLIRLPDSLDSDEVRSFSRSIGTASCGGDSARAEADKGSNSVRPTGSGLGPAPETDTVAPEGDR